MIKVCQTEDQSRFEIQQLAKLLLFKMIKRSLL
ncbi:hypothetical protein ABAC460_02145 [Asticcacaulis sp. AC460]|nr:hypothetical protein ABAC460_02145 [Asticcacaulis sp. AC460]